MSIDGKIYDPADPMGKMFIGIPGLMAIAEKLGRSPSAIAREIARNGGRENYRAVEANTAAYVRARRPKSRRCPCGHF